MADVPPVIRPRLARALAAVAAVTVGATVACSTGGEEPGERTDGQARLVAPCEVLDRDAPGGGDGPGAPEPDVGYVLTAALRHLDSAQVQVYLDPGSDGQLADLERALAEHPQVTSTWVSDVDETFALFQDLFAGEDRILANMRPVDLPTSVTARTDSVEAAAAVASWAEELDDLDLFDVRSGQDQDAATPSLGDTMVAEPDRAGWADLADDLERVEGRPAWGALTAELVRTTLEQGEGGDPPGTLAARRQAHDDLLEAQRGCRADA